MEGIKNGALLKDAITNFETSGDPTEIDSLFENKLSLTTNVGNIKNQSVLTRILTSCVDGDEIIKNQLDKCVTETGRNEYEIDFSKIFKTDSDNQQCNVVNEIMDLRNQTEEGSESKEAFTKLIEHPVIATFIQLKWKKTCYYFYITSIMFFLFLILYSSFTSYIFTRPEKKNSTDLEPSIGSFMGDWDSGFSFCEIILAVLWLLLVLFEAWQIKTFKKRYLAKLENWMEIFIYASTAITVIFKDELLTKEKEYAAFIRGIAALGIFCAWINLIFMLGQYPFKGGDFSIMFYNVVKKIWRYLVAFGMMVIGFAFGFTVIKYGQGNDNFQNPMKSGMVTLTMVLGEFNFSDIYDEFNTNERISRGFIMFLLLLLIIFGTITMINLFVAAIIKDMEQLKREAYGKNLINMAENSIVMEKLLPNMFLRKLAETRWSNQVEKRVTLCTHRICQCKGKELQKLQGYKNIKEQIQDYIRV